MSYFILPRLLHYSTQTIGSLVNTAIQYTYGPYMGEEERWEQIWLNVKK
jgi:hypothetical protein